MLSWFWLLFTIDVRVDTFQAVGSDNKHLVAHLFNNIKCFLHLLPEKNMNGENVAQDEVCSLLTSKLLNMRTHQRIRPLNPTGNVHQYPQVIAKTRNILAMVREKPMSEGSEI